MGDILRNHSLLTSGWLAAPSLKPTSLATQCRYSSHPSTLCHGGALVQTPTIPMGDWRKVGCRFLLEASLYLELLELKAWTIITWVHNPEPQNKGWAGKVGGNERKPQLQVSWVQHQ